mmetsp:Transcript_30431/g.74081  ORF Transcript_30431/g.74081 Transcript_30431/m.74081 type:complete len:525 (+) Transcript_30431:245-1819(+)
MQYGTFGEGSNSQDFEEDEQLHLNPWVIREKNEISQASLWEKLKPATKKTGRNADSKKLETVGKAGGSEKNSPSSEASTSKNKSNANVATAANGFFRKSAPGVIQTSNTRSPPKPNKTWSLEAKKAWEMFLHGGKWEAYPGAVVIQYDIRSFSHLQMETGTFRFSAHVRLLFFDKLATQGGGELVKDASTYYGKYSPFYKIKSKSQDSEIKGISKPEDTCIPPLIKTRNATGEEGDDAFHSAWKELPREFDSEKKIWKMEFLLRDVECCQDFELSGYPYDFQACNIISALILTDRNLCYISRENGERLGRKEQVLQHFLLPLPGQTRLNSRMPEYHLLPTTICAYNLRRVKKGGRGLHNSRPLSVVRLCVLRKHEWYTYNYIAVLFFISSLSFMAFRIERLADKLAFNAVVLLTITTYKYNATSVLPRIPTLTSLDKYILVSFGLVLSIMIWNFAESFFGNRSAQDREGFAFLLLLSVWTVFHVLWFAPTLYGYAKIKNLRRSQVPLSVPNEVILDSQQPHFLI